ncbi:MAG: OsmC family protein [Candidatus Aminicenantes bacterium]|nr:OsmC family protein [Candidatus Aminicenantes bacterium]
MNLEAKIDWEQGLAFQAHLDGFDFVIDGTPEAGGKNLGPRPKGLTLVSLLGCTGMDVISILGKMKVKVEKFAVSAEAALADEHPKKIVAIKVIYDFTGPGLTPEPLRKAVALSEEKYCGVRATLAPAVTISHEIVVNGNCLIE